MSTRGLVWLVAAIALNAFCDSSLAQNAGRDAPYYFVANKTLGMFMGNGADIG
jgi:hypothetical protein